ncbi:DUF4157 domain-containing protein [Catenulispora sp. NF23]|uniref:DUF4157 domain-containing protein n=1 Tax=Catenulispora pinistramenti TaxID=2705254 RepID=A0ABS5L3Z2_9ACTN|nr:DUF4157 domain-containing protein [Catenulispora pinistramenti]MBS2537019.1 DUF4157 domain-containing protein [Catenulispora pinistramenti]MBS2553088.1 DUF4157 domain-containing protein [Catenulispora pinistramenti]
MRDQDTAKAGKASSTRSAPARSAAAPSTDPTGLLSLQRSIGNAAVVQLLAEAGDAHAQEGHEHGPGCGHGGDAPVQRSSVQSVLSAPGSPLAAPMRAEMESRLGADFSDVRLHTGGAAQRSAAEIGARAYTSGNHVVIGDGGGDKHTLAHELTHVIQQRRGPVAGTDNGSGLKVSDPSDRFEREAEANATRALSSPLAAESANAQAGAGAESPVQRAAVPSSSPASPAAADQVQRAGATGLLERGKEAVKHGADVVGATAPPTADFMAGGLATGGNTPGDFGKAAGVGAAGIAGGVMAVPDLAVSVIKVSTAAAAWIHARHGSVEERHEARKQFEKALAETASNTSAVGGGVAGGVGTITGTVGPGVAGGGAGIFTGLYGAIKGTVDAVHADHQKKKLEKAPLPAQDNLLAEFQGLESKLDSNHTLLVENLKAQHKLDRRKMPASADKATELALKARHDERLATCNAQYDVAKMAIQENIAECREMANLHTAKDLAVRKSGRKRVRSILAAAAGTLGIPAGALSIVAVVLGLSAGAIPIAGWAIAGVVGLITTGVLTWKLVNKVRANLKHLRQAPDADQKSGWKIYLEAMQVWKPKADSTRDQAAATLFQALTSQFDVNKSVAEELVKALRLKPEELLKMPADKAVAKIKDRLAST